MDNEIISKDLLEILACPKCKTGVRLVKSTAGEHGLQCGLCSKIYLIKEGIPVMLINEAITPGDPRFILE